MAAACRTDARSSLDRAACRGRALQRRYRHPPGHAPADRQQVAQATDADQVVPVESVIAFRDEMQLAQANWQINIYSDAKHSFTGEGAVGDRTPESGLHPQTEARSWQTTVEFLREVFK